MRVLLQVCTTCEVGVHGLYAPQGCMYFFHGIRTILGDFSVEEPHHVSLNGSHIYQMDQIPIHDLLRI